RIDRERGRSLTDRDHHRQRNGGLRRVAARQVDGERLGEVKVGARDRPGRGRGPGELPQTGRGDCQAERRIAVRHRAVFQKLQSTAKCHLRGRGGTGPAHAQYPRRLPGKFVFSSYVSTNRPMGPKTVRKNTNGWISGRNRGLPNKLPGPAAEATCGCQNVMELLGTFLRP